MGVSYAIGNAIFGGTAEYVALSFKANGVEWGFAWYVVAVLCVALMSVIAMPDMQKAGHMASDDDPVA